MKVTSQVAKVPKIPVDQLITGAVKQYIDYVKTDADVQGERRLLSGISEQNSSPNEEQYKPIDTTLNGIILILKTYLVHFCLIEDENKNNSSSPINDQNPNQQTENIFMTEVCLFK